jgi:peroxiredoxin Q/BCP
MVSLDGAEQNAAFAASLGTDLPVLSDPEGAVARKYGVLALGGLYARRWTFYIDPEGRIRAIDKAVSPNTAGADIVRTLGELDFPKTAEVFSPEEVSPRVDVDPSD